MPITLILDTEVDLHDLIALTDIARTARGKGKGFLFAWCYYVTKNVPPCEGSGKSRANKAGHVLGQGNK